jgi:hypothetical protein
MGTHEENILAKRWRLQRQSYGMCSKNQTEYASVGLQVGRMKSESMPERRHREEALLRAWYEG